MSVLSNFFGFPDLVQQSETELPIIFPLDVTLDVFVETDIMNVYSKILTDCVERTQGLSAELQHLLFDSCLKSDSTFGLISLLAMAMTCKSDLYIVFNPSLLVLRQASTSEAIKIKEDYVAQMKSDLGIFVSFKNYRRTDMVRIYSGMEYCVVSSLNKMTNLSKAIQFKMGDMRGSVSLTDSSLAVEQARAIAKSLRDGRDILLDKEDEIVTGTPDISSIKQSISFLDAKRCFYYGMPLSYISGEQTTGISSTGEADTKAVERGLKQYYISVLKPVIEALFEVQTSFKSTDFRQINSALEALKTFDLVSNDYVSKEDKQFISNKLFDLEDTSQ